MQDLILLHGAIGAKDQLTALADILKADFRVHTFNFSGHGGKAFPATDLSIPLFSEELRGYLDQNNISAASIFGYSMGGYVALYFAKQYPLMAKRIVTLATKFYWDEEVAAKETKMLNADTILEKVPAFARQLEDRHHPNDWRMVLSKTKEMLLQLGRKNSLNLEDYKSIQTPALLLLGDKDKMVTKEETLDVAQSLPHGTFKILPATPHPLEQADMTGLAGMIRGFISR